MVIEGRCMCVTHTGYTDSAHCEQTVPWDLIWLDTDCCVCVCGRRDPRGGTPASDFTQQLGSFHDLYSGGRLWSMHTGAYRIEQQMTRCSIWRVSAGHWQEPRKVVDAGVLFSWPLNVRACAGRRPSYHMVMQEWTLWILLWFWLKLQIQGWNWMAIREMHTLKE